jgi:hypothetical protein
VLLTFNPTGWSWFHWAASTLHDIKPPLVLAGIALLIGGVVFLSATMRRLSSSSAPRSRVGSAPAR